MDKRLEFEINRKLLHLFLGAGIATVVYFFNPIFGRIITIPLILTIIVMLILSKVKIKLVQIMLPYIFKFERKEDIEKFPFKGAIWFGIGVMIPILLIPNDTNVICAIIMILAMGDSFSTIVGMSYGKHKIRNKSVEGTLAFVIFGFLGALIFVNPLSALMFAIVGSITELFAVFDDNLLIPLFLTIFYLFTGI